MLAQVIIKKQIAKNIAAEPRSFARPDHSWWSSQIRSTTASIAEFITSTKSNIIREPFNSASCIPLLAMNKLSGNKQRHKHSSCLNADSYLYTVFNPKIEHRVAFNTRVKPEPFVLVFIFTDFGLFFSIRITPIKGSDNSTLSAFVVDYFNRI